MPWVSWDFENAGLADEMGATMPPGTDGVIGATWCWKKKREIILLSILALKYTLLEIKTFGLVSRIRDVEVGCLKNHNFLP